MKKNFLTIAFMTSSALLQGMNNDGSVKWQTIAAVAGVTTVGGVAIWRATAPSDTQVLLDLGHKVTNKNLQKYNQEFDTSDKVADTESQVFENVTVKLQYNDLSQSIDSVQNELHHDAQALKELKNSIWFRSYFNNDVAAAWKRLDVSESNAVTLQPYVQKSQDCFIGYKKYETWRDYKIDMKEFTDSNQGDFIHFIQRHHLGSKGYPLLVVTAKLLQDITWINNLKGSDYPRLKDNFMQLRYNFIDWLVVSVQNDPRYEQEKRLDALDKEEQRKQVLVDTQLIQAQAQERLAQAASKQADTEAVKAKIAGQRLKLAKAANERDRVDARVRELRRSGCADRDIQRILNHEKFSAAVIGCFFGTND